MSAAARSRRGLHFGGPGLARQRVDRDRDPGAHHRHLARPDAGSAHDPASSLVAGGDAVRTYCGTLVRVDAGALCRFFRLFLRSSPRGALSDWWFQWQAAILVLCPLVCRDNSSMVRISAVDAWQAGGEQGCLRSAPAPLDLSHDDT